MLLDDESDGDDGAVRADLYAVYRCKLGLSCQ
jgi:hypothetical protein